MNPHYLDLPLPADLAERMKATEQNPRYHAEGDVYAHTSLVLRKLQEMGPSMNLTREEETILHWAAVLHDIGKVVTTVWQDGRWRSPGHERAGVAIARDILLAKPEITTEMRRKILDLVRWHGHPLRWTQQLGDLSEVKALGTRTDLRLLAIFAQLDFHGRMNVEHDQTLKAMQDFRETHVPRAEYELGRFDDLQKAYAAWNRKQRNAAWNALRMNRMDLVEKLLHAPAPEDDAPAHRRKVIMTIGLPKSGKSTWLDEHHPDAIRLQLSEYHLETEKAPESHNLDRRLVEFKYYVENFLRRNPMIIIEGRNQNAVIRQRVNDLLRDQGVHIHYVIFESSLDQLIPRASEAELTHLREQHAAQELIHPWEAHSWEAVAN